ncbi:MAG: UbiA family prenyltransferase [Deltaproteobacteria bacterium]|nr:UbiA family prenyltransferase [Deltaproteobacteria bacterium]
MNARSPRQLDLESIYVDLDGTLISSDMLWESLWLLLRSRPADLVRLPGWLLGGKAHFKEKISSRVQVMPETLPYRPEVVAYLETERARGRRVILATASNRRIAEAIAQHLGLFDGVLASDGTTNLSGETKRKAIEAHCAGSGFEYLGNGSADIPVWRHARRATLVAPSRAAASAAAGLDVQSHTIETPAVAGRAALRALRPYQWVKNLLLFVPLLLAHEAADLPRSVAVGIAFACFCLIASATYILNDLLDIESDRQHPRKRERPFASGALPIPAGIALLSGLPSLALLPLSSTAMLAGYAALTVSYSFYLKERLLIDVLILAGLYTHRVLAGAVAAQVPASEWLLAFSMFFFLSLALVKRYAELLGLEGQDRTRLVRRAYEVGDRGLVENSGLASGYMSVLVLCLYISSDDVALLYPFPELLWLICPIMLYWISRIWFLARRRVLSDDPVLFATRDPISYLTGALVALVGLVAAW